MTRDEKREKNRRRLIRDLTVAAILVVVVIAYYIPSVASGMQDLSLSQRKSSYKTEQVRFTSENSLLAERLRMIMMDLGDRIDFIEMESGQKMDRETAEKTALRELDNFFTLSGSEVMNGIFKYYSALLHDSNLKIDSSAGMALDLNAQEPFVLWVISVSSDAGFDVAIVLDESSGKMLSVGINDWSGNLLDAAVNEWSNDPQGVDINDGNNALQSADNNEGNDALQGADVNDGNNVLQGADANDGNDASQSADANTENTDALSSGITDKNDGKQSSNTSEKYDSQQSSNTSEKYDSQQGEVVFDEKNWVPTGLVETLGEAIASYYGMNLTGSSFYLEEPFIFVSNLEKDGEAVHIPVIITEDMIAFNSPDSLSFFIDYGLLPTEILNEDLSDEDIFDMMPGEETELPEAALDPEDSETDGKN